MQTHHQALFDKLQLGMKQLGLQVVDELILKMLSYVDLLLKWNKVFNLTAITQPDEVLSRHILDSLSIIPFIAGATFLDVGSGAGLPGIPCALILPDVQVVLLDSNGKKTRFLTQVVTELQIKNVAVVQTRIEDYHPSQCFETITARALSSIENIISSSQHVLCPNGQFLIMKGVYPLTELQKLGNRAKVHPLSVPFLKEQRHLVCIKG